MDRIENRRRLKVREEAQTRIVQADAAGWTQEEIAEAIPTSRSAVSLWIGGELPSYYIALRIKEKVKP